VEIYGGQDYDVKWKKGMLQFVGSSSTDSFHSGSSSLYSSLINRNIKNEINYNNTNEVDDIIITKFNNINNFQSNVVEDSSFSSGKQKVIFASVGYDILLPPGGVFVGLIKEKSKDIRPTLLGQLGYNSIRFDTRSNYLTLSKSSLLSSPSLSSSSSSSSSSTTKSTLDQSVIRLIDLRQYGDPVCHYAVQVRSLEINNRRIGDDNTTIYAIFDTGTSGCVLSDDIVNDYNTPNPIRQVGVTLLSEGGGDDVYIQAKATRDNLFVVKANKITWFRNKKKLDGYSKNDGKGVSDNNYVVTTRTIDYDKYDENDDCLSYHDNDIIVNTKQDSVILDHDDDNDNANSRICRSLNDNPQIVVLGLAFFANKILTIDTIACRLKLE
jgi:hypothetical protein